MKTLLRTLLIALVSLNCSCQSATQDIIENDIVFNDGKGNTISKEDLKGATGNFNWEISGNKKISKEAVQLHDESRRLGQSGEYDEAIVKLNKAHELEPEWAYPVYDLAFTYLLKQDYENALKYYRLTDQIEPRGFFTAKTSIWCLEKELKGEINTGLYLAFIQLEWMENKEEVNQILEKIVAKYPTYAPAWEKYSSTLEDENLRLESINKGLDSSPDQTTEETLLINKAIVLDLKKDTEQAIKLLGDLILNKETTVGNKELAKFVLGNLTN